jgi:acetolactate synthase-1/2/3 large subunit
VVVDVPEDICHDTRPFDPALFEIDAALSEAPALRCRPARGDLAKAVAMLKAAKRPLMLCGGGVHISRAEEAAEALAHAINLPVAHTMTGKGAIACNDPLSAGLFGRYDRIANKLIDQSDCLLVVGCKLGEIATKRYTVPAADKAVIHLDNVAEEFGRTFDPALRLWSDAREGLLDLTEALAGDAEKIRQRQQAYADEVAAAMAEWRRSVEGRLTSDETPVSMARLVHELNAVMPEDGLLVADGGFAAHWGALLYDTKKAGRGFVPDRGFASIGYGLPGAIGAALAAPGRPVVGLTGDGGFNMVMGELETARRLDLPLTVIVVNNAASGYVKALQHLMYGEGSYQSSDLAEMNYARVAEALGCGGIRVERPEELKAALAKAIAGNGPTLIDVVVTRDPAKMLPGVDNRTAQARKGDRVA